MEIEIKSLVDVAEEELLKELLEKMFHCHEAVVRKSGTVGFISYDRYDDEIFTASAKKGMLEAYNLYRKLYGKSNV